MMQSMRSATRCRLHVPSLPSALFRLCLLIALAPELGACVAIQNASWAAPVPAKIGRTTLKLEGYLADAPYDIPTVDKQVGMTAHYERGVSQALDLGGKLTISGPDTGVFATTKYSLLENPKVSASLGGELGGFLLPLNRLSYTLGEFKVPLRLGWNVSRSVQIGLGYALGARYEVATVKVEVERGGATEELRIGGIRPTFSATLACYIRLGRSFHFAPELAWRSAYGAQGVLLQQNGQVLSGAMNVYF